MDIKVIKDRISKKEDQIRKIERRIAKWEKPLTQEDIKFVKKGIELRYGDWRTVKEVYIKNYFNQDQISDNKVNLDELRSAYLDLRGAKETLDKYINSLAMANKKADALSQEKIEIIWEFLQGWKEKAAEAIRENTKLVEKYYDINTKIVNMHNGFGVFKRNHTPEEVEDYREEYKKLEKMEEAIKNSIYSTTWTVYNHREKKVLEDKLNKTLDEEVEAKYLAMIDKITPIVGEINDAKGLSIDPRGDINGIIIGNKGKAKINTILAGGDNAGVIVNVKRGPVLHFRMLVKPIK